MEPNVVILVDRPQFQANGLYWFDHLESASWPWPAGIRIVELGFGLYHQRIVKLLDSLVLRPGS